MKLLIIIMSPSFDLQLLQFPTTKKKHFLFRSFTHVSAVCASGKMPTGFIFFSLM